MDPNLLIFGGGVAAFITLLVWLGKRGARQAKARAAANAQALDKHGWKVMASSPTLVNYGDAAPFRQGRERRATEVVRAKHANYTFVAFQYHYVTESKDDEGKVRRSDHEYEVAGIKIKGEISGIKITPEGLWDGKYDLDVESDDFNKKWRVQAEDKRFAHALLSPTVIALLVDRETATMPIIFEPGRIWTYHAGGHEFGTLSRRLQVLAGIADEIPDFVFKEAKVGKTLGAYVEAEKLKDDLVPRFPPTSSGLDGGGSAAGRPSRPSASARRRGGGSSGRKRGSGKRLRGER